MVIDETCLHTDKKSLAQELSEVTENHLMIFRSENAPLTVATALAVTNTAMGRAGGERMDHRKASICDGSLLALRLSKSQDLDRD